jgi:leucyl aminopeptidase
VTTYSLRAANPAKTRAEAVVVGVLQGAKGPVLADGAEEVAAAYGRKARGLLASLGVSGKAGEVVRLPAGDTLSAQVLVLVGLGPEVTTDAVRRAAGAAARAVPNATSVALALPAGTAELVRAVTEGAILGGYTFTAYRSGDPAPTPADVILLSPVAKQSAVASAFAEAQVLAAAVGTVRDWVNTPPNDLTPPVFADAVVEAATGIADLTTVVYDEQQLEELGCGGILAVGKGSAAAPRLVELTYAPADAVAHVAFVGKGITFDSGGLSIKTGAGMATMKSDMHGAASVVQATLVIARLGLPVRVSAFVPMAENMISGAAMRPGDIITHYGGTTSEMLNADAEGRLILADALVRATEVEPDAIIDVATLTGAMVAALGDRITGVMGTPETVDAILAAAAVAGEDAWPMPLPEIMEERVHSSKIADLAQHDFVRWGGGLFAGAFLREFTAGLPWAHLDIAGPSWNGGGAHGHITPGGTGTAVATLVDYARALASRT